MEKTKRYRFQIQKKVQRFTVHAKRRLRYCEENEAHFTKRILEVCREEREGLGAFDDA